MRELPESETYEEGLSYWPYKTSLATVLKIVREQAPKNGSLLDIMCGPGYLLSKIKEVRPDLRLTGVDIDERYVSYGQKTYLGISFEKGDVLDWKPKTQFDMVLCTGSVHHIPYEHQGAAITNIVRMAKPDGLVIISDCYVDDYSTETERKLAAAKLGHEYIRETIKNGGSDRVIDWTIDILWNDVFRHEFKPSLQKRLPLLQNNFADIQTLKAWPEFESGYGDYIHICKPK